MDFEGPVELVTFGAEQYVWHPAGAKSHADPDGPAKVSKFEWKEGQTIGLPKASMVVASGKVAALK
jgi:hypothetical protein